MSVALPFGDPRLPSPPARLLQWLEARRGRLGWEQSIAPPLLRARAGALGDAAPGPPRVLVRVEVEVLDYDAERRGTRLSTRAFVGDVLVVDGEAKVIAPA